MKTILVQLQFSESEVTTRFIEKKERFSIKTSQSTEMALHSSFPDQAKKVCGLPLLPLRTNVAGPAPLIKDRDIVDEAFEYFRVNVLFKNYELKEPSDKVLVYLTVLLTQCFKITENEKMEPGAKKRLGELVTEKVPRPKDKGYFMASMLDEAANNSDLETYNNYLKQLKEETALRFLQKFYTDGIQMEDYKFWAGMAKKKFMGYNFSSGF